MSGRSKWLTVRVAVAAVILACAHSASAAGVKLSAPPSFDISRIDGARVLHDYGSYVLLEVPAQTGQFAAQQLAADGVQLLRDSGWLLFDNRPFNTQERGSVPTVHPSEQGADYGLHLVQFTGPIQGHWLDLLRTAGATPVHYIANYGYLVWADATARSNLAVLAAQSTVIQFSGRYHSVFKYERGLETYLGRDSDPDEVIPVTVQVYRHPQVDDSKRLIESLSVNNLSDWWSILEYENTRIEVRVRDLQTIARRPDVFWIGEFVPPELLDEVQTQIIAGQFTPDMSGPASPGYLSFLVGLGFPNNPSAYPLVDIVDDGVGNGSTNSGDQTLHRFGILAEPSRLQFVSNCTQASSGEGVGGHGHLNANILGGFDTRSGFPYEDPDLYQRGQGVNPWVAMGGTRIFSPVFDLSACGGTLTSLIKHTQDMGVQISSNSWGCESCAGTYNESSQAYDVGVRDADLVENGNQELMHIFASGNTGPGSSTVATPGNAKNVLTVGASENKRPADEDGNWTDGCGVFPSGANDAMDVIGFSGRGPAPGGRVKPETIAPGTHIYGTASTSAAYNGFSVCDQYKPSGQTAYAASSGTSHSTPAVSGVTSFVWWWIKNNADIVEANNGALHTPSPALLKAYVTSHPTYLTGFSANDDLPSNVQGFGMPNMSLLFDDARKNVVNQSVVFENSGETWTFVGSAEDATKPVRIMLAYTDQAGAVGTSPQVNDLNLTVQTSGGTYRGNNFSGAFSVVGGSADSLNNYEAVFLPAGTATDLTVTVTGFNIAGDGVPNSGDDTDQDFALVCYNCDQDPTFTLSSTPRSLTVCAPDDAQFQLDIDSILGFSGPVSLSASGHPAGTSAIFSNNPVTPPGISTLTIGNTGVAAYGDYTIAVDGVASAQMKSVNLGLQLFTGIPGASTLSSPINGQTDVSLQPTLAWSTGSQTTEYLLEVATDYSFNNIVYSVRTSDTSHEVSEPLNSNTVHYWRVSGSNGCGENASAVSSFITELLPGDCSLGIAPLIQFNDDMESGAPGWSNSSAIGPNTWMLTSDDSISGASSWHAEDVDEVSDQRLVTPAINLPSDVIGPTLQFWNRQRIESAPPANCWDGAIVEVSTDGGANWTQLDDTRMLSDPYDGPVNDNMNAPNPLTGLDAWCGDPQDWLKSVVDLSGYQGMNLMFRFRLGTDGLLGRPEGWRIDDVAVQSCPGSMIFLDGMEDA